MHLSALMRFRYRFSQNKKRHNAAFRTVFILRNESKVYSLVQTFSLNLIICVSDWNLIKIIDCPHCVLQTSALCQGSRLRPKCIFLESVRVKI